MPDQSVIIHIVREKPNQKNKMKHYFETTYPENDAITEIFSRHVGELPGANPSQISELTKLNDAILRLNAAKQIVAEETAAAEAAKASLWAKLQKMWKADEIPAVTAELFTLGSF